MNMYSNSSLKTGKQMEEPVVTFINDRYAVKLRTEMSENTSDRKTISQCKGIQGKTATFENY